MFYLLFLLYINFQRQLRPSNHVPSHKYPQFGFKATSCSDTEHEEAQRIKQATRRVCTIPPGTSEDKLAKRQRYVRFRDAATTYLDAPKAAMPVRHWLSDAHHDANSYAGNHDTLVEGVLGVRSIELFDFVHWMEVQLLLMLSIHLKVTLNDNFYITFIMFCRRRSLRQTRFIVRERSV